MSRLPHLIFFSGGLAVCLAQYSFLLPARFAAAAETVPAGGTLPAGTVLRVRMMDSVSSRNPPGSLFTTRLELNLEALGATVLPAGTLVYGKVTASTQESRVLGRSSLELQLTGVAVDGSAVPLTTGNFKEVANSGGAGQAARGAVAGAAVGALIDGHQGAQTGAAYGAALGVLRRGQVITVPPGTLLEFSLAQPLTVAGRPAAAPRS